MVREAFQLTPESITHSIQSKELAHQQFLINLPMKMFSGRTKVFYTRPPLPNQ